MSRYSALIPYETNAIIMSNMRAVYGTVWYRSTYLIRTGMPPNYLGRKK